MNYVHTNYCQNRKKIAGNRKKIAENASFFVVKSSPCTIVLFAGIINDMSFPTSVDTLSCRRMSNIIEKKTDRSSRMGLFSIALIYTHTKNNVILILGRKDSTFFGNLQI